MQPFSLCTLPQDLLTALPYPQTTATQKLLQVKNRFDTTKWILLPVALGGADGTKHKRILNSCLPFIQPVRFVYFYVTFSWDSAEQTGPYF